MGSVKDIIIIQKPLRNKAGIGRFVFSDRYSVFDWGEMPDHIEDKGKALCLIGAYFFEKVESLGIKTHYIGLLEEGRCKRLYELKGPSNCMEFRLLRVLYPKKVLDYYDYSLYKKEMYNYLIPLEVVYRNYIIEGSSLFQRLNTGKLKYQDIGLNEEPIPDKRLGKPIIETSTKLEPSDRYLSWKEAEEIAGLTDSDIEEIKRITLSVNEIIDDEFDRLDLKNLDGKFEFGFDPHGSLILVDIIGTPDESRLSYNNLPLSKEIARIYYRQTPWYKAVDAAKSQDRMNWRDRVKLHPDRLPRRLAELISQVYKSIACELTQREWFKDTIPLKSTIKEVANLYGNNRT